MKNNTDRTLKKVEDLLNVSSEATKALDTLTLTNEQEIDLNDTPSYSLTETEEFPIVAEEDTQVFELTELKRTFILVKRNLQATVDRNQELLDQTRGIKITEMKASEISAVAELSNVTSNQLKMLVEVYKDIIQIEKGLRELKNSNGGMPNLPPGASFQQNNIILQGSTQEALKQILDANSKS